MNSKLFTLLLLLLLSNIAFSQNGKNANNTAGIYDKEFLYGSNMDWKNANWSDGDVADLLLGNPEKNRVGTGTTSLRPALYEYYVEKNGYDNRVPYFQHYKKNGAKHNVIFIGDRPSPDHQEVAYYCKDASGKVLKEEVKINPDGSKTVISYQSKSFKNLYEPIWVNGKINEKNYYANYVYKLVQTYKDYATFYEIKNEPDYTSTGQGDLKPGTKGNWWDNNPDPKSLKNFYAPVQSYVRMLRISYEVIKHVDPNALVCVGGIGYASFLDAILRNTDNPDGGKVTSEYQLTGGAWFDCLSFHNYPMYYLREWVGNVPGNIDNFKYDRHTDYAVDKVISHKNTLEDILSKYGYGKDKKYPRKEVIITETNIPNKRIGNFIGGESEQRNFLLKMAVMAQKNEIRAIYPYCPWDFKSQDDPKGAEYDYKGFYYPVPVRPDVNDSIRMHESASGWRTISNLLDGKKYNEWETKKLGLPDDIRGAAFGGGDNIIYALWAKTTKDLDETANATYAFSDTTRTISVIKWDSKTKDYKSEIINDNEINLTSEVAFYVIGEKKFPVSSVALNESLKIIEKKDKIQLKETVYPIYASDKNVTWSSSDTAVATVDNKGVVTGLTDGIAYITVKSVSNDTRLKSEDSDKLSKCKVVVGQPANVPAESISMNLSGDLKLTVKEKKQLNTVVYPSYTSDKTVRWNSSKTEVATVDQQGNVTAIKAGEAYISVRAVKGIDGKETLPDVVKVIVSEPTNIPVSSIALDFVIKNVIVGDNFKLNGTISPSNAANKNVTWTSSASDIASVDRQGNVTTLKVGTAYISVITEDGEKTAACMVIVENPENYVEITFLSLDVSYTTLTEGSTLQLKSKIIPANATNKNLIWTSDNSDIAIVDQNGLVTTLAPGTVNIKATSINERFGNCKINVNKKKSAMFGEIEESDLKVYSNGNDLHIKSYELTKSIEVYNLTGKLVYRSNSENNETVIPSLSDGVYIVRVLIGDKFITRRIKM